MKAAAEQIMNEDDRSVWESRADGGSWEEHRAEKYGLANVVQEEKGSGVKALG
jgi:hypothetical protein